MEHSTRCNRLPYEKPKVKDALENAGYSAVRVSCKNRLAVEGGQHPMVIEVVAQKPDACERISRCLPPGRCQPCNVAWAQTSRDVLVIVKRVTGRHGPFETTVIFQHPPPTRLWGDDHVFPKHTWDTYEEDLGRNYLVDPFEGVFGHRDRIW